MIFSTVRRPQDPAFTVESLAITATTRPPTLPRPVITPSAGNSASSALAKAPSSMKLSGSTSMRTRSRANSFPASAFFWWYLAAPPFAIRASSAVSLSSNGMAGGACSRKHSRCQGPGKDGGTGIASPSWRGSLAPNFTPVLRSNSTACPYPKIGVRSGRTSR